MVLKWKGSSTSNLLTSVKPYHFAAFPLYVVLAVPLEFFKTWDFSNYSNFKVTKAQLHLPTALSAGLYRLTFCIFSPIYLLTPYQN